MTSSMKVKSGSWLTRECRIAGRAGSRRRQKRSKFACPRVLLDEAHRLELLHRLPDYCAAYAKTVGHLRLAGQGGLRRDSATYNLVCDRVHHFFAEPGTRSLTVGKLKAEFAVPGEPGDLRCHVPKLGLAHL